MLSSSGDDLVTLRMGPPGLGYVAERHQWIRECSGGEARSVERRRPGRTMFCSGLRKIPRLGDLGRNVDDLAVRV